MRRLLLCLMFVSLGASADDLSEANRLLAAKEYGKALPLYAKAAKAGNGAVGPLNRCADGAGAAGNGQGVKRRNGG